MKTVTAIFILSGLLFLAATASAHPATGIVVDRAGNVYFSDLETIWKIDPRGTKTVFRAGVSGRHVHELSIDDAGNIYGGELRYDPDRKSWPGAIWKMTSDGKFSYLIESNEKLPAGAGNWLASAGNLYFIDQNNHAKTQTLLLRRDPAGNVSTLAGSLYGHKDGQGAAAQFGSVGGMAFGPDGNLYLTDGASVRKVTMEGIVTTIAKDLNFKTLEDRAALSGGTQGGLTGLSVDNDGNVYVADAGNRRLLKVTVGGKAHVVYQSEPSFFPNGVFASPTGEVFVMEVGNPGSSSGPRIRKISGGKNEIITAGVEAPAGVKAAFSEQAGSSSERLIELVFSGMAIKNFTLLLLVGLIASSLLVWRGKRRARRS